MIPLVARVASLAAKAGPTVFTKAAGKRLAKQGMSAEQKAVEASLRKVVRDQASNIRTGRRYEGVNSLKLDEAARKNFNYEELARRVAKGEAPNTAARDMLFRNVTLTLGNGEVYTGKRAEKIAQKVTTWNRELQTMRQENKAAAARLAQQVSARTGITFTTDDLKLLSENTVSPINLSSVQNLQGLDRLLNVSPVNLAAGRHTMALRNMRQSTETAGMPDAVSNVLLNKLESLGPGRLAQYLSNNPVITLELFGSSDLRYRSNIRSTFRKLGISEDPNTEHMKALERYLGH